MLLISVTSMSAMNEKRDEHMAACFVYARRKREERLRSSLDANRQEAKGHSAS